MRRGASIAGIAIIAFGIFLFSSGIAGYWDKYIYHYNGISYNIVSIIGFIFLFIGVILAISGAVLKEKNKESSKKT